MGSAGDLLEHLVVCGDAIHPTQPLADESPDVLYRRAGDVLASPEVGMARGPRLGCRMW